MVNEKLLSWLQVKYTFLSNVADVTICDIRWFLIVFLCLLVSESVASQHEAMSRAVMLADRNKQLEKELHDIDQMALAVEAECNSTVKENSMRVSKIQVRKPWAWREM